MSPRILKEIRLLFWPWFLMTSAGVVPVMKLWLSDKKSDWPDGVGVLGFFGGAAVLSALSFRQALPIYPSTLDLGEAARRYKIWSEKMAFLMAGMVSAGFIACFVQTVCGVIVWRELPVNAIEPVMLLVIMVCTTGFWTLLTRSVFGGLLLTGAALLLLYLLLVLFVTAIDWMGAASLGVTRLSHKPKFHFALSWFVAGVGLIYAVIMLWLCRRKFASMKFSNLNKAVEE